MMSDARLHSSWCLMRSKSLLPLKQEVKPFGVKLVCPGESAKALSYLIAISRTNGLISSSSPKCRGRIVTLEQYSILNTWFSPSLNQDRHCGMVNSNNLHLRFS